MPREERSYRDDDRGRDRDRDDRRDSRRDDRDDNRSRDRGRDDDRGGRGNDRRDRGDSRGGGRSSGRSYAHHNKDSVRKHADQSGGSFEGIFKSGIDIFRAKEGDNAVRILPPTWENYDHYGFAVYVHNRVGASGSAYTCPIKNGYGKSCAACEEVAALKADGEEDDAIKLSAKKNYCYYIIDRDDRKPKVKAWQVGWRQDKDIADASENKRKNLVKYIDLPDDGYDVFVKRTGTKLNTRYTYQTDSDSSPIDNDPDIQDDILKEIEETPISELIVWATNEKIAQDLEGGTRKKDGDEDEGREGTRRGGRDRADERSDRGGSRSASRDDERGSRRSSRDEPGDEEDRRSTRGDRLRGSGDRSDDRDDERPRDRGRDDERSNDRGRETRGERSEREGREERSTRGRDDDDRGRDRDDRDARSERGRGREDHGGSRDRDEGRDPPRDSDRSRRR